MIGNTNDRNVSHWLSRNATTSDLHIINHGSHKHSGMLGPVNLR